MIMQAESLLHCPFGAEAYTNPFVAGSGADLIKKISFE